MDYSDKTKEELIAELTKLRSQVARVETFEENRSHYLDLMADFLCIIDFNNYIKEVNPACTKMLGWSVEELMSKPMGEYLHPEDQEHIGHLLTLVTSGQAIYDYENRILCKDGTYRWLSWRINPVPEKGIFYAVARDVTEKKQSEEALYRQEALLASIFKAAPTGIGLVSNRIIKKVNDNLCSMTGYSEAELLGQSARILYPTSEEYDFVGREKYSQILAYGSGTVETRWRRKDGKIIPIILSSVPLNRNNLAAGVTFTALDITDRKIAENALLTDKELLAVTLRCIGDGVITTDRFGKIMLINKVAEQLTGWTQTEATGRDLTEVFRIINEKTQLPSEDPVAKVLKSSKSISVAYNTVLIARDGTERLIADSGAPIFDAKNRIIGVVLVFRDVTEKQKMEAEISKAQKLESIGLLAGGIAHDFNNILTGLSVNLSYVSLEMTPDNEYYQYIQNAEKSIYKAKSLAKQMLTFTKSGAPLKEAASIADIITDSVNFVLHGTNVKATVTIPGDLWKVEIDRGQISQVIHNLVLNAYQAMPAGGLIEISAINTLLDEYAYPSLKAGKYIKITVKDNGAGILPENISKIFDPFFTTKDHGSGLGLAITYSIITKHDGYITVTSEPQQGAMFTFFLPASEKPEIRVNFQQEQIEPLYCNILVMDDEEIVLKSLELLLKKFKCTTTKVTNSQAAIKEFRKNYAAGVKFDLIILDLTIPGGPGGIETLATIKKIDPDAKVIVSSGYTNDVIVSQCQEHGFSGILVKPFTITELYTALKKALQK